MKRLVICVLALGLLLAALPARAGQDQGEKLVRELWALIAAKDLGKVAAMTSPSFQAMHASGAQDKAQEMRRLAERKPGAYTLSHFQSSEQGPVLVVAYQAVIGGASGKPALRLEVFINRDAGWQWLAHADLEPGQ